MHVLGHLAVEGFYAITGTKTRIDSQRLAQFQTATEQKELAGLSLEDEIESRIVQEEGPDAALAKWASAPYGRYLPRPARRKWTLLIQAVDHWIPEAADLLDHFRFIPSWRVDDLMISYAVSGGSVGPHYDQYDVFLLQAEGQREWRLGQMCDENTQSVKGLKIRLLENFEQSASYVLNPGDMLYLPPKSRTGALPRRMHDLLRRLSRAQPQRADSSHSRCCSRPRQRRCPLRRCRFNCAK